MAPRGSGQGRDVFGIVGTIVDGRYRVERMTGEGGFGVVYLAHHLVFDSPIALKVLKLPGRWTPERTRARVAAFQREGKVLFELSALHMSILRAFEAGSITFANGAELPYLALEWLEGASLADELRLRRERGIGPLSLHDALTLLHGPATALALAHRRGVVHRDIKPGNLFVTRGEADPVVKILDFGLAKIIDDAFEMPGPTGAAPNLTSAFTPMYAAPEQWERRFGPTSSATDVHGLALVCAELLTGRVPFEGAEASELMAACLDGALRPTPKRRGAELPAAVEAVFERAVMLDPAARFPNMETFWSELCGAADFTPRARTELTLAALSPDDVARHVPLVNSTSVPTNDEHASTAPTLVEPRGRTQARQRRVTWILTAAGALTLALLARPSNVLPSLPSRAAAPSPSSPHVAASEAKPPVPAVVASERGASAEGSGVQTEAPVKLREAVPAPRVSNATTTASTRVSRSASLATAESLLEQGNVAGACERAEAVFERAPSCAACAEFLGRCTMRLGQTARSLEFYRRYLALDPDGKDAVFVRAILEPHER